MDAVVTLFFLSEISLYAPPKIVLGSDVTKGFCLI